MGYGEVGGDGSIYVSVHLRHPDNDATEESANAGGVHSRADARNPQQRSARARAEVPAGTAAGRGYRGRDAQDELDTDAETNVFLVTIHFSRDGDLSYVKTLLNGTVWQAGGTEVSFPVKVIERTGQVHVEWPDGLGTQAI
jgi:hypothetical protein